MWVRPGRRRPVPLPGARRWTRSRRCPAPIPGERTRAAAPPDPGAGSARPDGLGHRPAWRSPCSQLTNYRGPVQDYRERLRAPLAWWLIAGLCVLILGSELFAGYSLAVGVAV